MSDATGIPSPVSEPKRRASRLISSSGLWKEKPLGTVGGIIVLILIFVAIFADVLAPYPHDEVFVVDRLTGPSARYLLGTDQIGRDFLSRLIYGARLSIVVGMAATTLNVVVAFLIGGISGFLGGKLDLAVQRFVGCLDGFPGTAPVVNRNVHSGAGSVTDNSGPGSNRRYRRLKSSQRRRYRHKENVYFQAAEAIGSSKWRTFVRHVLPNIMPAVIIIFSINIGGVIIAAASLSFLGFGLPPGIPDWGGMLSREGREYMEMAPRLALWPGFALTITVYCLNMFGDAVRDLLDPRLRGGGGHLGAL